MYARLTLVALVLAGVYSSCWYKSDHYHQTLKVHSSETVKKMASGHLHPSGFTPLKAKDSNM